MGNSELAIWLPKNCGGTMTDSVEMSTKIGIFDCIELDKSAPSDGDICR